MKILAVAVLLLLAVTAFAKETVQVKIVASHSVTHDARDSRAIVDAGMLGPNAPKRQVESYNLDAVINGEHVTLACDDPKGCEQVAPGDYDGEVKHKNWIRLSFTLPVTHKEVSRWYKIAGSW